MGQIIAVKRELVEDLIGKETIEHSYYDEFSDSNKVREEVVEYIDLGAFRARLYTSVENEGYVYLSANYGGESREAAIKLLEERGVTCIFV